jgi:hypothetical protein
MLKDESNGAKRMPNLKNLVGAQKSKFFKPLFMGMKAFMHVAKKGDAFLIYALLATNARSQQHDIMSQYKGYMDVFERNNVDTLPKHQPYDCTIDLEGVEPPFGPIYNLSQNEFLAL